MSCTADHVSREDAAPAQWHAMGQALRDFFMARHGRDMQAAFQKLADSAPFDNIRPDPLQNIDWLEAEYAFNRLFIGPAAVPAPPYASVYLENEPQIMGDATMEVRELFHALGLRAPQEHSVPDDHISYEIDACLLLDSAQKESPVHAAALRWLGETHMAQWVPRFVQAARAHAASLPLSVVLDALEHWISHLQRRTAP